MHSDERLTAVAEAAARHDGLRLLLLHGSRSRGGVPERTDWDFAYQGDEQVDPAALHAAFSQLLGTDRIDVTDLGRTSALLRFQAAQHGHCVYEDRPGTHEAFVLAATLFWCDVGPVIRRAQDDVLAGLPSR